MKKFFLIATALVLAGAGCTMNQWKLDNGAKFYVKGFDKNIAESRCSQWLTIDEANSMSGVVFTETKARYLDSFDKTACEFRVIGGSASGTYLSIEAGTGISKEATIDSFDFWAKSSNTKPIEGLGDRALWHGSFNQVWILTGGVKVIVGSFTLEEAKLLEIAKTILPRFQASDWGKEMLK